MEIRQSVYQEKNKIKYLLETSKAFTEQEICVALEVFDDAFVPKEIKDYYVYSGYDDNGNLEGYVCFGPIPLTESNFDLYWIVVDRSKFRSSIGTRLIEFAEKEIRYRGGRKMYIDTSSTEPYAAARAFYEKRGYSIVANLKDFYRAGDHKIIFMKKLD